MKKFPFQSLMSSFPLLRCCLLYRSRPPANQGEDEYADEGNDDFDEEDYDDNNPSPFFSRRRDGSLQNAKKRTEAAATPPTGTPTQFRRRYTLATPSFGGLSTSLPNGRGLAAMALNRTKALALETSSTVSDDEAVRSHATTRDSPLGTSPVRHRSDTPRSFPGTTVRRTFSTSSSVSDWAPGGADPVRGVGRLTVVLDLTAHTGKLTVTMTKIEFPPYQHRELDSLEVSVMLLPRKGQSYRAKHKNFNEPIAIYLFPKDQVHEMSLRFRLYEQTTVVNRHLLGEGTLRLKTVNLDAEMVQQSIDLQPPGAYVPFFPEAVSSPLMYEGELAISEEDRPEILLSLEYRRLTGKLLLEVIKTRNLGMLTDSKAREMYVDVKLIGSDGLLMSKGKTTPRRHMVDPEYNEMFLFQLPEQELNSVTVLITVKSVSKKLGRKVRIGRVSLGQNYSGDEELRHWYEMTRSKEKSIVRWHRISEVPWNARRWE